MPVKTAAIAVATNPMPVHAAVIAFTATTISVSALWQRRSTWRFKWERPITLHLACIVACCVLTAPIMAHPLLWLHTVTGMWNFEDLAGHTIALAGLSAYAIVMLNRLELPKGFAQRHIGWPVTIVFPTMVGMFLVKGPDGPVADLWQADVMPLAYWWMLSGTSLWLLGHALWALFLIRATQASFVVNAHIASVVASCGSGACQLAGAAGLAPTWLVWVFGSVGVAMAAVAGLAGMASVRRALAIGPLTG